MERLRAARHRLQMSQREIASRAGLSFRGYQLLEAPDHDARIGSIQKVARALGLPPAGVRRALDEFLSLDPRSIRAAGFRILAEESESWMVHLFDFVDGFRQTPESSLVADPPPRLESRRVTALLAATVEALSAECGLPVPPWTGEVPPLRRPWFVSGMENLKASALVESPVPFRGRNIFVLGNFLARA